MIQQKVQRKQPVDWHIMLIYALVLLFAIDFLDESGIIISATFLFAFISFPKLKVDVTGISLIFFGVLYTLSLYMYESVSLDSLIKFLILPFGTYYVGNILGENDLRKGTPYRLAKTLAFGFYIHAMLNMLSFLQIHGISFDEPYRLAYEFWRGNAVISVTACNLYYTPMAVFALGVFFAHKSNKCKFAALVVIGTIVFAMMLYQNRTTLALMAIIVAVTVLIAFFQKGIKSKLFWLMMLAGIIIGFLFAYDVAGIRTMLFNTRIYERISGEETAASRSELWFSFLKGEWWKYPLGGKQIPLIDNLGYVHNLWLDTWWRVGFIPFVLLVGFTCKLISLTIKNVSNAEVNDRNPIILLYMIGGLLINFCVEPVLEANPFIMYNLTLIAGAMQGEKYEQL